MGSFFGYTIPLPQPLLDAVMAKIELLLKPILGPIRAVVTIFTRFRTVLPDTVNAGTHLVQSAYDAYNGFTTFSFKASPRTRVIQSVRAYEELRNLIVNIPTDVLTHLRDLFATLKSRVAVPEAFSPEDIEGLEDLTTLIKKLGPKLEKAFGKILGVLALVLDAFTAIQTTIDDLQHIVDDIDNARRILEDLKGFYLPQRNKREKIKLEDGSTYYRRIRGSGPGTTAT
jgi:hypothetical protein